MNRIAAILAVFAMMGASAASAKCADEVKTLQGQAAKTDAATKPGQQQKPTSPGTMPEEGGGAQSASAKILEAQAQDQKGDEAACMRAVNEAKALMAK